MKLALFFSFLSLNLGGPFIHLSLLQIDQWPFKIYTLEKKKTSPLYIYFAYTNASNYTQL